MTPALYAGMRAPARQLAGPFPCEGLAGVPARAAEAAGQAAAMAGVRCAMGTRDAEGDPHDPPDYRPALAVSAPAGAALGLGR
jgi:hypothetical protein